MSQLIDRAPASAADLLASAVRPCAECGYDLRGFEPGHPCPECGHRNSLVSDEPHPHTAWARSVLAGLMLMLLVTLHGVSAVLIQPFDDGIASSTAALNLPGPKLWAMPLLQRPIGHAPEWPGVDATRTALLGLLAVWLITAPSAAFRVQRHRTLRCFTRWMCVIGFGLAFGALTATQDIWPTELPPFRIFLVGVIELPGTLLLYLYLRTLAAHVPGRQRRATFDLLVWLVPATIAAGAAMLGAALWLRPDTSRHLWNRTQLLAGAGYGTVSVLAGVIATAAVASLATAYVPLAFPKLRQLASLTRSGTCWLAAAGRTIRARQLRVACVIAGLALLLALVLAGNERTLWISARAGLGGNLPFVNFPGPKVWCAEPLTEFRGRYEWPTLLSRTAVVAMTLTSLWLIGTPIDETRNDWLRRLLRWAPTMLIGAAIYGVAAIHQPEPDRFYTFDETDIFRSQFFAAMTVICELPATMLLYAVMARLSREMGRAKLAREFLLLALAIVTLVGVSMGMFALSQRFHALARRRETIAAAAAYGAIATVIAIWAIACVLRLIGALLASSMPGYLRPAEESMCTAGDESRPSGGAARE